MRSFSSASRCSRAVSIARGGLVGEERQQARVGRREVEDAAVARLLVGHGEDADPAARRGDRDREALLAGREAQSRRRGRRRRVVDDGPVGGQVPARHVGRREDLAADVPGQKDAAALGQQDEASLARVRQRDRPEEHLVGEGREIELPGERQAEIVERLELEQTRPDLEVGFLDEPREPVRPDVRAEERRQDLRELDPFVELHAVEPEHAVQLPFRLETHPERAARKPARRRAGVGQDEPAGAARLRRERPAPFLPQIQNRPARAGESGRRVGDARGQRTIRVGSEGEGPLDFPPRRAEACGGATRRHGHRQPFGETACSASSCPG